MIDAFCSINEARVQRGSLFVSQTGPWYFDAILDDSDSTVSGRVKIQIGTLQLQGTALPAYSGGFVLQRSVRVVAGAGGWGTPLAPKAYHHDPIKAPSTPNPGAAIEAVHNSVISSLKGVLSGLCRSLDPRFVLELIASLSSQISLHIAQSLSLSTMISLRSGGVSANASFGASLGLSLGGALGASLGSTLGNQGVSTGGFFQDSLGGVMGIAVTGALNASAMASPLSPSYIAADIAGSCGETLGAFDCGSYSIGTDYAQGMGPASSSLQRVIGSSQWWVDPSGVTHVGTRPILTPVDGSYSTENYSPIHRTANISVDDPSALWVGSVLTDRLAEPQTIREMELHIEQNEMRIKAYCGGSQEDTSRVGRVLDSYIAQREAQKLHGVYQYRVFSQNTDSTLALQAVKPALSAGLPASLPDLIPVTQSVGVAKALSTLSPGDIVRVMFDNGDPRSPFVAFYPPGDPDKVSGIVRMSDLVASAGYGTSVVFSLLPCEPGGVPGPPTVALASPTGTLPVVACGIPYLVSFGNTFDVFPNVVPPAVPPVPADAGLVGNLFGYALSASEQQVE